VSKFHKIKLKKTLVKKDNNNNKARRVSVIRNNLLALLNTSVIPTSKEPKKYGRLSICYRIGS
jgi:hypothetical protein